MAEASEKKICGIVMPISECDGRSSAHWADVLSIIKNAATTAGFDARLVSETFETNLIHKEILRNIYEDDVIVCDVSGRNPNVFFELGIRMATQKPTVVIKDNVTVYPFDTSVNRYIEYPRDLRHPLIEKFKAELAAMIKKVAAQKPEQSFIGQLGPFQVPNIESTEISASDAILKKLDALERRIPRNRDRILTSAEANPFSTLGRDHSEKGIHFREIDEDQCEVRLVGYSQESIENAIKEFKMEDVWHVDFTKPIKVGASSYKLLAGGPDACADALKAEFTKAVDSAIPF